ncbi:uncharacterized protein LOC131239539 isoform X2 [Magnolia sinica]|uniref:uncharacterized protein LOC131239539 isoform X2 n=1 Tax=Magnolia sinica TaxID=86752 RepID=UPI00265AF6F5|nr:uncharacterized protein LOC131239539 isoform X2 [Magnolia sinica]
MVEAEEPIDLESIRSRLKELSVLKSNSTSDSSNQSLQDCLLHLESRFKEIESEFSDLGFEDLEVYVEHAKKALDSAGAESEKISDEIRALNETFLQDSIQLEGDLEMLETSLSFIGSQGPNGLEAGVNIGYSISGENQGNPINAHKNYNFEILELDSLIQKNSISLRSLLDLQYVFERVEAVRQVEDILSDVKVVEFEGNCIRLSLNTLFPSSEGLLCQQKLECITEPFVLDHELQIELMDGTTELKNVEIFPNDVYIGEIIDAAKFLRHPLSSLSCLETRSNLEWLVRKVQHQIFLCTLRRLIVKHANNSRHSFEYSDRDETITAHLAGNVDAFIKISRNWPVSTSALKLVSLKNLDFLSKGISLSFLCKELANSLDEQTRSQLPSFADAIEEILVRQQHLELQSDHMPVH